MRPAGRALTNPRHEIFARCYALEGNKTKAAIQAGYAEGSAHVQGHRMLKNDKIARRVQEIRDWSVKHSDISDEELLTHVTDLAMNADRAADQINASKLILHARGIAQPPEKRRDSLPSLQVIKNHLNLIVSQDKAEEIVERLRTGKTIERAETNDG